MVDTQHEAAMAQLNEFDLAFVVDTTGSMGGLIAAAQRQMTEMIDALASAAAVEMRLGIVEYRDHPPQDTLICKAYPFTSDLRAAKKTLSGLKAGGGGDGPEAVFAGLIAARDKLAWREHSRRIAVLVGDAPPHGVGSRGDGFPAGCPSGETIHSTSAKLEDQNIRLYAIGLTREVTDSFGRLSTLTGGKLYASDQGAAAIEQLKKLLTEEFGQLDFDRQVHGAWTAAASETFQPSVEYVAERLAAPPARVAAAVSRLSCRNLLAV
jgi:Mg-chelatase subunit ChlD